MSTNCVNCGAPRAESSVKCQYCGTVYEHVLERREQLKRELEEESLKLKLLSSQAAQASAMIHILFADNKPIAWEGGGAGGAAAYGSYYINKEGDVIYENSN